MLLKFGLTGLLLIHGAYVQAACGDQERKSKIYKAIEDCRSRFTKEAVNSATFSQTLLDKTTAGSACGAPTAHLEKRLATLCSDPKGTVCQKIGDPPRFENPVLTSKCQTFMISSSDVVFSPSFVELKCKAQKEAFKALSKEKEQDSKLENKVYFKDQLAKRWRTELTHAAYSHENEQKLSKILERVKSKYIDLIDHSTKITAPRHKALLKEEILDLKVYPFDSLSRSKRPETVETPEGPLVTAFKASNQIVFSLGFLAQLDDIDPYALIQIISHEAAHALDPCQLEYLTQNEDTAPLISKQIFGDFMRCLRGGKGEDGCENAVVHCWDRQSKENDEILSRYSETMAESTEFGEKTRKTILFRNLAESLLAKRPNCGIHQFEFGEEERGHHYRQEGSHKEQIGEAFADAMSAEVMGSIMQENHSSITEADRADTLQALSYALTRLHGECLDENTPDSHPSGYLRISRLLLGNSTFREAVGCLHGPPQTKGAGVTCSGL